MMLGFEVSVPWDITLKDKDLEMTLYDCQVAVSFEHFLEDTEEMTVEMFTLEDKVFSACMKSELGNKLFKLAREALCADEQFVRKAQDVWGETYPDEVYEATRRTA